MLISRNTTAIVVDSTADLPEDLAQDPSITIVPLTVFFGQEAFLDWVELKPEQFYEKLATAPELPKTSQPSVGTFLQVYRRLRERYERVYSIHLSAELSGTYASACLAQAEVDGVTVIDSRLATGATALLVDRLIDRLEQGVPEADFNACISHYLEDMTFLFLPTTLDYLHKGGRIGRASHLMGTMLNLKPVLTSGTAWLTCTRRSAACGRR